MKTLILAAIRYSLMLLPECGLMPLSVPAPEKPLCTQPATSCTRSRLTRRLVKYFAQMRRPSSYTSVVKSALHVYEVRPREGHRNVGFRCAAVWSAVVAKVTGAIGYARHQSRSRDALIRQHSMRYKNLVVFTALALPALTHLSAVAQTCPDNVPHITGTWTVLPYQMPIQPISATLLPNGKVLIVAGSENDASNNSEGAYSYRGAVWDPSGNDETSISVHNLSYDIFCSGTAALFDGRSLIVGGTSEGTHYNTEGENRASIFNPVTNQFVQSQNMVDGRWYGTATALADGRIMAMSGLNQTGGISRKIEIYDLQRAGAGWNPPTSVPFIPTLYPRLELLPGGRVFYTGHGTRMSNANAWIFDPATGGWTQSATTTRNRRYGSSVLLPLLPPSYVPRVMNFGGEEIQRPLLPTLSTSPLQPRDTPLAPICLPVASR